MMLYLYAGDVGGTSIASDNGVMRQDARHLDIGSRIVIVATCVLFVAALFIKGFGHGVLLEAGVFLVSVKLIIMSYKNSVAATEIKDRLLRLERLLAQTHREPEVEQRH
jgi:hypothetical protein